MSPHWRNAIKPHCFTNISFQNEYKFVTTSFFVTQLWRLRSVRVRMPQPSGPLTRWVAFHWMLWTLQLDKHTTAHSACLAAVQTARPRQDPWFHFICRPIATTAILLLLCRKIKNMTPGSCALCPGEHKSQLYGGPCWGLQDLCACSFPFSHPDHRTIFRGGEHSGAGWERGKGWQVFPLAQTVKKSSDKREDSLWLMLQRPGALIRLRCLSHEISHK